MTAARACKAPANVHVNTKQRGDVPEGAGGLQRARKCLFLHTNGRHMQWAARVDVWRAVLAENSHASGSEGTEQSSHTPGAGRCRGS